MYKRILAAIDWTPGAESVLDHTQRLALSTGAAVHVLHVQPMDFPAPPSVLGYLASQALACELEVTDAHSVAHRMVDNAVSTLSRAGIHAEGTLLGEGTRRAGEALPAEKAPPAGGTPAAEETRPAPGTRPEGTPRNTSLALLEHARDLDVQLIVLGSRHYGRPSALLRPNLADEVCHHAQCPIVIVPPL